MKTTAKNQLLATIATDVKNIVLRRNDNVIFKPSHEVITSMQGVKLYETCYEGYELVVNVEKNYKLIDLEIKDYAIESDTYKKTKFRPKYAILTNDGLEMVTEEPIGYKLQLKIVICRSYIYEDIMVYANKSELINDNYKPQDNISYNITL